jgi:hypothetical protein
MRNKPSSKSWNEIEMLISAIAIALTLGLWNLFASPKKSDVASVEASTDTPQPTSTVIAITPAPSPMLLPGQVLLLGGTAPQPITQNVFQPSPTPTALIQSSNGGNKGGKPVTKTHSSHP